MGCFVSCRISTDKRVARSLCHSRATCFSWQEVLPYMNAVVWPIATMSNMAGVWTVTVVTLHRYIAVCLPHHVTKFANLNVARYQASLMRAHSFSYQLVSIILPRLVQLRSPGGGVLGTKVISNWVCFISFCSGRHNDAERAIR